MPSAIELASSPAGDHMRQPALKPRAYLLHGEVPQAPRASTGQVGLGVCQGGHAEQQADGAAVLYKRLPLVPQVGQVAHI